MSETTDGTATPGEPASPLQRIAQERTSVPPGDIEERRAMLTSQASNNRYWVRLNVSALGWVALVEKGESGATSALGDVLDLGGGGCVLALSNAPGELLREGQEISISLRPGSGPVVTCTGQILGWKEMPSGVQLRIAFTSTEPEVHRQLADAAVAARVRLLQISHREE